MSALLLAVIFLLVGNLFATGADVFVKNWADASGIYQYLFLRQCLLAACLYPLFRRLPQDARVLRRGRLQAFRANLTVIGGACVFVALTELTLATANVLFYASPVLTLLLAAWWFKEPLHKFRLFNIACCFAGVVVALQPDSGGLGILAGLAAALCIACHNLLVRYIPSSTPTIAVMFWGTVLSIPLMAILSVFNWQPFSLPMLYLVVGSAVCVCGYQLCCIVAYRRAEAGAIALAEYSGLVFAALLGWWLFSENIDIWTATGMAMIIFPIFWQTVIEHKRLPKTVPGEVN
ncbi:membrane protein [Planctobacterium marinum]|uniref:Membrane protein n=1 Tax=Planctobacterium marinum TaxID=1631968 RepID=A0AA48KR73_9ALTE|nr:membrane protein [Planctobacterium marinum]